MPRYSYKCSVCGEILEYFHSMSETKEDCEKCGEKQTLKKIPSQVNLVKLNTEKKVGSLVKKSIEEFRQDLEQEKENLRNEFYTTYE